VSHDAVAKWFPQTDPTEPIDVKGPGSLDVLQEIAGNIGLAPNPAVGMDQQMAKLGVVRKLRPRWVIMKWPCGCLSSDESVCAI